MSTPQIAAEWVVNMEDGPERRRLWDGHRARRIETWDDGSYAATDHSKADAWLITEWERQEAIEALAALKAVDARKTLEESYAAGKRVLVTGEAYEVASDDAPETLAFWDGYYGRSLTQQEG